METRPTYMIAGIMGGIWPGLSHSRNMDPYTLRTRTTSIGVASFVGGFTTRAVFLHSRNTNSYFNNHR